VSNPILIKKSNPLSPTRIQGPKSLSPAASRTTTSSRSASRTVSSDSLWNDRQQTERLSHEEQKELLLQAVERRRIQQIESELQATQKPHAGGVTALQVSRAAGYGDELLEFETARAAGEAARQRLVTTNMGLVHYCVTDVMNKRRRRLQAVTRDDLVQEGAIGLARAVDRWNPAVGGKFSTYAVYWIRAAVLRCIAERDDLVRVPEHVTATLAKVTRAAAGLNVELNSGAWREAAHAKALAERAGISDRQLAEAMKVRERRNVGVLSFESWMQQGQDYETDLVSSPTEELSKANSAVDVEQMKQTLSRFLRPREMEALSLRYGLDEQSSSTSTTSASRTGRAPRDYVAQAEAELFGDAAGKPAPSLRRGGKKGEAMSFVEVGQRMKVSAEYGRRLCHAALDKLRRAAEEGALEPAFLC